MTRSASADVPQNRQIPLSHGQMSLWFLDRLHHDSTEYHIPEGYRLIGPLVQNALESAVNVLLERHEVLRSRVAQIDGRTVQEVLPSVHLPLSVEDISGLPPILREQRVTNALRGEWYEPFDLAVGPMLRYRLLRLAPQDHVLVLTVHHIASDGWSQTVLRDELAKLYEAFRQDMPNPLGQPPAQYATYVEYRSGRNRESVEYWTSLLADLPSLTLPADRPRMARSGAPGGVLRIPLPREVHLGLRKVGADAGATPYMTFLAAFVALLAQISGQDDIAVGTPVADRSRIEFERMVGFLVNTLVLRVRVEAGDTFHDLVRRVRAAALDAYRHHETPFEQVVEALAPQRDPGSTPLFQVMFTMQNMSDRPLSLAGLEVRALDIPDVRARFDLELHAWENAAGTTLTWVYNDALFDRERIEQLATDYVRLATQFVAEPYGILPTPSPPAVTAVTLSSPPVAATARVPARSGNYSAPAVDGVVARLFAEVLGLSELNLDDDFFLLGGHSLLALSLVDKLTNELGIELDVRDLFIARTPAQLSVLLSGRRQ